MDVNTGSAGVLLALRVHGTAPLFLEPSALPRPLFPPVNHDRSVCVKQPKKDGTEMEFVLDLQAMDALEELDGHGGGGGGPSNLSLLAICHNSTLSVLVCGV
jgi:hypothetical protein